MSKQPKAPPRSILQISSPIKTDNIMYLIKLITDYLDQPDSLALQNSIEKFKHHVSSLYIHKHEMNKSTTFIDELLTSMNVSTLIRNPALYLLLMNALLEVNTGDKSAKAHRIFKDLKDLPPCQDPTFYQDLSNLINFIIKMFITTPKLVVQNFQEIAFNWLKDKDPEKVIAAYYIVTMLADNYHDYVYSQLSNFAVSTILKIDSTDMNLISAATSALKAILMKIYKTYSKNSGFSSILGKISNAFQSKTFTYIEANIQAAMVLLDFNIEYKQKFSFQILPLDYLASKEVTQRNIAHCSLWFAFRTSPRLFEPAPMKKIYKLYQNLLKKKAQGREEALLGFGKFLFEKRISCMEEKLNDLDVHYLEKIKKVVLEQIDTPKAIYCYLSILAAINASIKSESKIIYSIPINSIVTEGLMNFFVSFSKSI